MNQLNYCFECSYRCKLPKPLPKHLIKLTQRTKKIAPWIHQLVDQKYE